MKEVHYCEACRSEVPKTRHKEANRDVVVMGRAIHRGDWLCSHCYDIFLKRVKQLDDAVRDTAPLIPGMLVGHWEVSGPSLSKASKVCIRGGWHEDGSRYEFEVPEQLAKSFLAMQRVAENAIRLGLLK